MDEQLAEQIRTIVREELDRSASHISADNLFELNQSRAVDIINDLIIPYVKRKLLFLNFAFMVILIIISIIYFSYQFTDLATKAKHSFAVSEMRQEETKRELHEAYARMDQITALLADYKNIQDQQSESKVKKFKNE